MSNELTDKIPGLKEAMARERLAREADFLSMPASVPGFQLRPMTLRDLGTLRLMESPFLYVRSIPSKPDTARFLWFMSPYFREGQKRRFARWLFYRRCRRIFADSDRYAEVAAAIHKWMDETFEDSPPRVTGKSSPSYFCGAVSVCALLAREYGWDEDKVLKMPLRRVFQYLNEIRLRHNPKAVLFNPSDRLISDWLEKMNSKPPSN